MSRAYRITVGESVRRDIVADDEVRSRLELLAILPGEEMATLLRNELLARGFQESGDQLIRTQDAPTITIDPCNGEVAVKVEAKRSAEQKGERVVAGLEDIGPGIGVEESKARERLRNELEKRLDADRERLQQETTRELEQALIDLQPELGRIVNKVTRDALKVQAARLGSVIEVTEDEATGSLTMKVEV